jgi:hypothetical protein
MEIFCREGFIGHGIGMEIRIMDFLKKLFKRTSTPKSVPASHSLEEERNRKLASIRETHSSIACDLLAQCDKLEIVDLNDAQRYLRVALSNSGSIQSNSPLFEYKYTNALPQEETVFRLSNPDDLLLLAPLGDGSLRISKVDQTERGYDSNPICVHLALHTSYHYDEDVFGSERYLIFHVGLQEWLYVRSSRIGWFY